MAKSKTGINEQSIIKAAAARAANLASGVGIGDDCACLPWNDRDYQLVSTDSLVQDVHFTKEVAPRELGHKSLAVNLSDIAAMGGTPQYALLNLSLPLHLTATWIKQFFLGFSALAEEHEVVLIGGDTTRSPNLISISVTIMGVVAKDKVKLRSAAQVGDVIAVTGNLGDARAGLECILQDEENDKLIEAHYLPIPQIAAGKILAEAKAVHAMMDLSDGLATDLPKMAAASNVGAHIELATLPTSTALAAWALRRRVDAKDLAAAGGEDYQLLVTMAADEFPGMAERLRNQGIKLTSIGEVVAGNDVLFQREGKPVTIRTELFSQF